VIAPTTAGNIPADPPPTIRRATADDAEFIARVAVDSGLFPAEAVAAVEGLMAAYFARTQAEGHACVVAIPGITQRDRGPVGVAYYEPKPGTDGTWELLMIAVTFDLQGAGLGSALLEHVERDLAGRGQRLLLVQTSGMASFARTRAFYERCGYEQEARVRDYYEPGDDMVLYRKDLSAVAGRK
jgi:ribosomal protein S18 acetylase RimI-like enzyme